MLHVDTRPEALLWYRDDHKYHYQGEAGFYDRLFELLAKPVTMLMRA